MKRIKRGRVRTPLPEFPEGAIVAFTDGSSGNKVRKGGWAFVVQWAGKVATRFGWKFPTTNNEMELTAILRVFQFVQPTEHELHVISDSEYCVKALTVWWKRWKLAGWVNSTGPVKNQHLIERILSEIERHKKVRAVRFHWIRGHAGEPGNEQADALAGQARDNCQMKWELTD